VLSFCHPILLWGFDHGTLQKHSMRFEEV